ncbi:peptidoglycan-binding protein [Candidatus Gracilibacteria bacterium]|nr:peptidoglycan-binding protein [Candidatus Gracilibacteria bacterium]MCF7898544.1 peptidoglycan-binding protein [Candidatus Paceibacterota bacterium]
MFKSIKTSLLALVVSLFIIPAVSFALPSGCSSVTGYSPLTGIKCDSDSSVSSMPAGCTGSSAFSYLTGERCPISDVTYSASSSLMYDVEQSTSLSACVVIGTPISYITRRSNNTKDVIALQEFLNSTVSPSTGRVYLEDQPNGNYYNNSRAAIIQFQKDYGILPPNPEEQTGYVGVSTRAKIKEVSCGGIKGVSNPVSDSSVGYYTPVKTDTSVITGTLMVYFNGLSQAQIITDGLTKEIAIDSCKRSVGYNLSALSARCTWGGVEIVTYKRSDEVTGVEKAYFGGSNVPSVVKEGVTKDYAIKDCNDMYLASTSTSIMCTWNGDKVYSSGTLSNQSLSASVVEGPQVSLAYDSYSKESMLNAKASVLVNAGDFDLVILKQNNVNWPPVVDQYFYFNMGVVDFAGHKGVGMQNTTVEAYGYQPDLIDKGGYWVIPRGKSAKFGVSQSYNVKKMFAGSYHAVPGFYRYITNTGSSNIISSKDGNYVTIIGETSPYISQAVDQNGYITISGSRLNLSGNQLYINGMGGSMVSKFNPTESKISIKKSDFTLTSDLSIGLNTLKITNSQTGDSNSFSVNINETGGYLPAPVSTSGPKNNVMSCSSPSSTGKQSGEVACYGVWDYGDEFGNDKDMCQTSMYGSAKTGCVVSTSACVSGKATASRIVFPTTSSQDISTMATNFRTSTGAVSSKNLINVWEYTCSGSSVQAVAPTVMFARTSGFVAQTVSTNIVRAKIGSFTIQNTSSEFIIISTSTVNLSFSGSFTSSGVSSLSVNNFGLPIGNPSSGLNYFYQSSLRVSPYATMTFDVYSDIGNVSSGSVTADMTIYYSGETSYKSGSVTATGVPISPVIATLANPVLVSSSPTSQSVLGNSTFGIAKFRLSTAEAGSSAIVRGLNFTTTGEDAIVSMTVNGVTVPVVNYNASVTGLSIPISSLGTDISVAVQFNGFQNSSTGGFLTADVPGVGVTLTYVEASNGAQVISKTTSVSSNKMTLVAYIPTSIPAPTVLNVKWGPQSNSPFNAGNSRVNFPFAGRCFSWTTTECGYSNVKTSGGTCVNGSRYSTDYAETPCYGASTPAPAPTYPTYPGDGGGADYYNYDGGGASLNIKSNLSSNVLNGQVLGASTMCTNIVRNLHRGAESTQVSILQKFLQSKGYMNEVTGFYGDKTIGAVKDYQASTGISQTGMLYEITRQAIRDETCR